MEMQDMLADRLKQKRALSRIPGGIFEGGWGSARARCKNTRPGPEILPLATVQTIADHLPREPGPAAGDVQRRRDGGCGPDVPDPGWSMGAFGGGPQGAGGAVPGTEPFPERRAGRGSRAPKERKEER